MALHRTLGCPRIGASKRAQLWSGSRARCWRKRAGRVRALACAELLERIRRPRRVNPAFIRVTPCQADSWNLQRHPPTRSGWSGEIRMEIRPPSDHSNGFLHHQQERRSHDSLPSHRATLAGPGTRPRPIHTITVSASGSQKYYATASQGSTSAGEPKRRAYL